MKRVLLISLTLVLALAGWSTVGAEDSFYVIPSMKGQYAPVPKTGKTTSSATGDDGALQRGVAWPTPRFTDNNNGTVTDKLTGLIWMKDASAFGLQTWPDAMSIANSLASGSYGLSDGSKAGDWRLPNVRELQSLIDYSTRSPAVPAGHPFTGVRWGSYGYYWSSTFFATSTHSVWVVDFSDGRRTNTCNFASCDPHNVWFVRSGP